MGVQMGYGGHAIYPVHIKSQKKVIRVKDLRIFEDYETKALTEFPDYDESTLTFQRFLLENNDEEELGLLIICDGQKFRNAEGKQPAPIAYKGRKVNHVKL